MRVCFKGTEMFFIDESFGIPGYCDVDTDERNGEPECSDLALLIYYRIPTPHKFPAVLLMIQPDC